MHKVILEDDLGRGIGQPWFQRQGCCGERRATFYLPMNEDRKKGRKLADPWGRWQLLLGEFLKGALPDKPIPCWVGNFVKTSKRCLWVVELYLLKMMRWSPELEMETRSLQRKPGYNGVIGICQPCRKGEIGTQCHTGRTLWVLEGRDWAAVSTNQEGAKVASKPKQGNK